MPKLHGVLVALVSGAVIAGSVQAQNASRVGGSTRAATAMPMGAARHSPTEAARPAPTESRAKPARCTKMVDGKCKDPPAARRPNAP